MQNTRPAAQTYDDEIDLRQLVGVLWRQKGIIAVSTLACATLGAGASLLSAKYVSEGLFLIPRTVSTDSYNQDVTVAQSITVDAFKRYESAFSNMPRMTAFLQEYADAQGSAVTALLRLGDASDGLSGAIRPEFAFTDKDARVFGVKGTPSDALIGIRLRYEAREPSGSMPVVLLAEYVRDTIIRVDMETVTLEQCARHRSREQVLRNAQIANDFAISQEEKRAATLRDIITRNPGAAASDNRQIVSLEKGSERFLSPAAQLVAAEIQIADMKLAEIRRERDRITSALKRDYYCQAQQTLQKPTTGRAFLEELKRIQAAVFQNQDKTIDIVEQTWNELDVKRENWANTYLQGMRFIASPEGAEVKERKPGLKLGIVLGGLLGGMLGMFIALVRAWWRSDQDETTGKA
ncbi:lipopolysaccharide biosynthesis protein [Pseudothauera nasutitermitis]|uniref:Chain length determinant protein n=1 Tax=Pseudothauera nasutitermitis TaxID=2565930 RepID=A0A4V3WBG0_9RHOO|nr:Wzz/FepE/Etk N-terminal domain-containing protein [Pseudothauera nasutitermitis]THF63129.1 lipopolysaccharide biosynthesis protein [Pseudothauera nasutitermitis]